LAGRELYIGRLANKHSSLVNGLNPALEKRNISPRKAMNRRGETREIRIRICLAVGDYP